MDQDGQVRSTYFSPEQVEIAPFRIRELESRVSRNLNQTGRERIERWLEKLTSTDPDPHTYCSSCGQMANFVSKRPGILHTRFGAIRYQRAYYVCPHCHQKTCPLDEWFDPYASLRRIRERLASGANLPVDGMARAWSLGDARNLDQKQLTANFAEAKV